MVFLDKIQNFQGQDQLKITKNLIFLEYFTF